MLGFKGRSYLSTERICGISDAQVGGLASLRGTVAGQQKTVKSYRNTKEHHATNTSPSVRGRLRVHLCGLFECHVDNANERSRFGGPASL